LGDRKTHTATLPTVLKSCAFSPTFRRAVMMSTLRARFSSCSVARRASFCPPYAHPEPRTVQARHRRRRRRRRVEWKTTFRVEWKTSSNGKRRAVPHKGWPAARPCAYVGLFGLWATRSLHSHRADRHCSAGPGEARAMAKDLGGGHRASDALKRAKTAVKYLTVKYPPQTYFTTRRCLI
jgi:hypothetical protein